jgi:DNA-binding protein YbaB
VDNDGALHNVADVLALVQEQMADLAVMQQKRSALTATGTAAGGLVEVSVDAQRVVTGVVIDESYLKEFELADLGGHIAGAAQSAGREIEQRSAALLAPVSARRNEISALSGVGVDVAEFGDVMAQLSSGLGVFTGSGDDGDGWEQGSSSVPTVRG